MRVPLSLLAIACLLPLVASGASGGKRSWRIGSDPAQSQSEYAPLAPAAFDSTRGYGFVHNGELSQVRTEFGPAVELADPAVFAVQLPEGSYRVALVFAPTSESSPITIKTEARRLQALNAIPSEGTTTALAFTAHTRQVGLRAGGEVALKPREIGGWHWDDRLQIEINAERALLLSVTIEPADELPTLYIMGDSTLTDQREEPWAGWGQILPAFLDDSIVVANYAESGLSLSSFKGQRRLEKVLEALKPGDFAMIQFGHNDQKEKGEGSGAWGSYTEHLQSYVAAIRSKGAQPILITPMKRRRFGEQGRLVATLGDFPLAVRQAAADLQAPLIDLNVMSAALYAAMGPEGSKEAFVHYPANTFPGQDKALKDDTHFNAYGAYEMARCVASALKLACPELARRLEPSLAPFDPAAPDPVDSVRIPPSPIASFRKPDGN